MELYQYCNMATLKHSLTADEYDRVRAVLGLEPMKVASVKGQEITQRVRESVSDPGIAN